MTIQNKKKMRLNKEEKEERKESNDEQKEEEKNDEQKDEQNDEQKDEEPQKQVPIAPLPSRKTVDEIPFDIIIECDLSLRRKLNLLNDKEN